MDIAKEQKFLRISARVFQALAWVTVVLSVGSGLYLLIAGGDDIPLYGGYLPARVVGVLNFISAAVYWFSFTFLSKLIHIIVDIHARVRGGA